MKPVFTLLFLLSCYLSQAQELSIRGIVKDGRAMPLEDATVALVQAGSKDTIRTVSNSKGIFTFKNLSPQKYTLLVTHIGFVPFGKVYDYSAVSGEQSITDVQLAEGSGTLENVVVEAPKIIIKEDTVSYHIDSSMYKKNEVVEDMLKRLPGLEVDNKTGAIKAQGQDVTKVKVNGKEFFGGDVTTATKNLDADMVERVDVIDDYGDQSAFTGIRTGDATKTLNIQLRKDKNKGYFGNMQLGGGTDKRYQNSATVNYFKNERQLSFIGNLNNTNAQSFNIGGMPAQVQGMIRSFTGMLGGAIGGGANGVTDYKSAGFNYTDKWSEQINVFGSYSYSHGRTRTISDVDRTNFFASKTIVNNQDNSDLRISDNHRATFNLEFKPNKKNYLKISPSFSFNRNNSNSYSDYDFFQDAVLANDGLSNNISFSRVPNISGSVLYNRLFAKKGRSLSLNFNGGADQADATGHYINNGKYYLGPVAYDSVLNQVIYQDNSTSNLSLATTYIEPLSKVKSLEFSHQISNRNIYTDKEYYLDEVTAIRQIDSLSNLYENKYLNNRVGSSYRVQQKKYNFSVGMAAQFSTLQSNSISQKRDYTQHQVNFYPSVRFAYNFARSRSFSINYDGSTSQPSYNQLQPVYDYSNPLYITVGNPELRSEFNNRLSLRFNNFDFVTGNVIFATLSLSVTDNKIVSNTINRGLGVTETRYLNADGYFNGMAMYSYTRPFQNRKYVLTYGGSLMFGNNLSYIDFEKNKAKNFVLNQRLNLIYAPAKWVETNWTASYTTNQTKSDLGRFTNNQTSSWLLGHNTRLDLKKDWIINWRLDKSIYNGYTGISSDPFIIGADIQKLIWKKYNAFLKLSGFDLLNQNTSINRYVSTNSIVDSRVNRLGRYALLTLMFKFNKFNGEAPRRDFSSPPPPPPPPGM